MQQEPVTIAIVDDHTLFRSGLASLLNEFGEIEIIFEAANGVELQRALVKNPAPQVILMDINMPQMDGYAATAWLRSKFPDVRVLALSMFDDEKAIISMLKAGASGYMLKESKPVELVSAIKAIAEKGFFINELVSGKLIHSLQTSNQTKTDVNFSAKELEFLQHCSTELTYKEIASLMNISPRTVDNYRESLFLKLQLKSRTGLVIYGIKQNLIKI